MPNAASNAPLMRLSTLPLGVVLLACCIGTSASTRQDRPQLVSRRFGAKKQSVSRLPSTNITFVHVNDIHAHLAPYSSPTSPTPRDVGGYARVFAEVKRLREEDPHAIVLDLGDEWQGTMFFKYYGWEKIVEVMNMMNYTAFTLGNHEFDHGPDDLANFLSKLTTPTISSNIFTTHSHLASVLHPYLLIPEHSLALIAATTPTTPSLSHPGPLVHFEDPLQSLQKTADFVRDVKGAKRVVAMTHNGYEEDIEVAKRIKGVNLIIGAHTHTPLGDFKYAEGDYPTIVRNEQEEEVFVVTSYKWAEHIGKITISFDEDSGHIQSYYGTPIEIDSSHVPDVNLSNKIESWKAPFIEWASTIIGSTITRLTDSTVCRVQECNFGNLVTDAMVAFYLASFSSSEALHGAISNSGGYRMAIEAGNITRGILADVFPYGGNQVVVFMSGREFWDVIEGVCSGVNLWTGETVSSTLQVSHSIKFFYDPSNPKGKTLLSVEIHGKPLNLQRTYRLLMSDFVAFGGDNIIPPFMQSRAVVVFDEDEALAKYIKQMSPLNATTEGRWMAVVRENKKGWWGSGESWRLAKMLLRVWIS